MNEKMRERTGLWIRLIVAGIFILGFLSMLSCTPEKRMARLLRKHPQLMQIDSVVYQDSVFIESVRLDTAIAWKRVPYPIIITDTLEKERLRIVVRREIDSLYISGECLPDTLIREIVRTEQKNIVVDGHNWKISVILMALTILVMIVIFRSVR